VLGLAGALQLDVFLLERLLEALSLRDVADGGGDQQLILGAHRAEADLDRKLAAVFAQAVQRQAGAHGADARLGEEAGAVRAVLAAETLRNEGLDRLSEHLVAAVAEESFRLRVYQGHDAQL